ncbi:transformer 2 beta, partial [Blyttiomyces sp. JEL0837]
MNGMLQDEMPNAAPSLRGDELPPPPRRENPEPGKVLGVFGLSILTREADLEDLFGQYGRINHLTIIQDKNSGKSRGFGFITYDDMASASKARAALNGYELNQRKMRVDYSLTKRPHSPTPGRYHGREGRDEYPPRERRDDFDFRRRDDYRPPRDDYRPPRDDYRPPRDDYRPPRDDYRPPRDDYRPPRDDYRPPREDYRPPRDDYRPREDFRRREDRRSRSPLPPRHEIRRNGGSVPTTSNTANTRKNHRRNQNGSQSKQQQQRHQHPISDTEQRQSVFARLNAPNTGAVTTTTVQSNFQQQFIDDNDYYLLNEEELYMMETAPYQAVAVQEPRPSVESRLSRPVPLGGTSLQAATIPSTSSAFALGSARLSGRLQMPVKVESNASGGKIPSRVSKPQTASTPYARPTPYARQTQQQNAPSSRPANQVTPRANPPAPIQKQLSQQQAQQQPHQQPQQKPKQSQSQQPPLQQQQQQQPQQPQQQTIKPNPHFLSKSSVPSSAASSKPSITDNLPKLKVTIFNNDVRPAQTQPPLNMGVAPQQNPRQHQQQQNQMDLDVIRPDIHQQQGINQPWQSQQQHQQQPQQEHGPALIFPYQQAMGGGGNSQLMSGGYNNNNNMSMPTQPPNPSFQPVRIEGQGFVRNIIPLPAAIGQQQQQQQLLLSQSQVVDSRPPILKVSADASK